MLFDPCDVDLVELQKKVENAMNTLSKNDSFLLEGDVNERSISHKLAEYLQNEFKEWNVDCEYNRDFFRIDGDSKTRPWLEECDTEKTKTDDLDAKTVYPDIIIHQRASRNNLLVIEIKKSNNSDNGTCDKKKIEKFIENIEYRYGLFICIGVKEKIGNNELEWFSEFQ